MNRRVDDVAVARLPLWVRLIACLMLLGAVTACGGRPGYHAGTRYNPSRYYPPPGPVSDPWGPYIHEASGRFGVPEAWVRRVMRQESGGQEDVISWAGAMGLMQVMPETYDGLRDRYGLGDDPFDPHNNILAGTAYIREMYDRYGAPGFLAAYNAGPNRLDRYLNDGTPLPEETVSYVASIAPLLGSGTPMSGPLAAYGGGGGDTLRLAARQTSGGCDPDAAYNPDGPCTPVQQPTIQPAVYATAAPVASATACDPDAAYDPTRPCQPAAASAQPGTVAAVRPAPVQPVAVADLTPVAPSTPSDPCDPDAAYDPARRCRAAPASPRVGTGIGVRRPFQETTARTVSFTPRPAVSAGTVGGAWGVQVGAFANLATAQAAAETARTALPDLLRTTKTMLPATTPFGGKVAFRARLVGLTSTAAVDACGRLNSQGVRCMTVPPARADF